MRAGDLEVPMRPQPASFSISTAMRGRSICCWPWRASRRSISRKLSILALADQYLAFIAAQHRLRLEIAADYLVMAAWLAYLKSRLLLPEPPQDDEPSGAELAAALGHRLQPARSDAARRQPPDGLPAARPRCVPARHAGRAHDVAVRSTSSAFTSCWRPMARATGGASAGADDRAAGSFTRSTTRCAASPSSSAMSRMARAGGLSAGGIARRGVATLGARRDLRRDAGADPRRTDRAAPGPPVRADLSAQPAPRRRAEHGRGSR